MNKQEHPHALSWEAPEFLYQEKTKDWYWVLWILFLATATLAFFGKNYTFAVIIVLAAFVLSLLASKRPSKLSIVIDDRHIHVGNKKYKTDDFVSYNVIEEELKLILKHKKTYLPVTVIPLSDSTPLGKVKSYLIEKGIVFEGDLTEPPLETFMQKLGF